MSDNNMTVIALSSDSDSANDAEHRVSSQQQQHQKLSAASQSQSDGGQGTELANWSLSLQSGYAQQGDNRAQSGPSGDDQIGDANGEEEEKARLISQILELQNTLDDLGNRVDSVKEENLKLRNENKVLGQYIENLMAASSVFAAGSPRSKRRGQSKRKPEH